MRDPDMPQTKNKPAPIPAVTRPRTSGMNFIQLIPNLMTLGAICAGLGYFAAQSRAPSASGTHPAVIAPPAVLVSDIAD